MLFLTQESELKITNRLQALYFYSTHMLFHDKMVYVLSQIEKKHSNVSYLSIDVGYFKSQCIRFSIILVPTILILRNGKEIKRMEGSVRSRQIINAFDDICTLSPINGEEHAQD